MVVQKLIINGFKSFERKTELDLNFLITAFVGPNGSGKSNIADAIRWVLGEQSQKSIRANKQEDLIFAGSSKKSAKGMAEVTLVMDNNRALFDLPYQQVAITRRVFRDGQSDYEINQQKVRLRDIQTAMATSGLGSFDLTVIGQGEIDQILIMGSDQILSLLEDASGVKPFYMRKQQTIRNLVKAQESILRLRDIMGELEPRLRELRKESKQAEAYKQIKQELQIAQRVWFEWQYRRLDTDLQILKEQLTKSATKKNELYAQIDDWENQAKQIEQEISAKQSAMSKQQKVLEDLQKNQAQIWQEQAGIQAKLEFNQSQISNYESQISNADRKQMFAKQQEVDRQTRQLEADLQSLSQQEEELRQKLDQQMESYQKLLDQINQLTQKQNAQQEIGVIKQKISQVKALYDKLSAKLFGSKKPKLEELHLSYKEAKHIHERLMPILSEVMEACQTKDNQESAELVELKEQAQIVQKGSLELKGQMQSARQTIQSKLAQKRQAEQESQRLAARLRQLGEEESPQKQEYIAALKKEQEFLQNEANRLEQASQKSKAEVDVQKQAISQLFSQQKQNQQINLIREKVIMLRRELGRHREQEQELLIQKAKLETKRDDLLERARQELGIEIDQIESRIGSIDQTNPLAQQKNQKHSVQELNQEALNKIEQNMIRLRAQLERMGDVNQKAPAEYQEVEGRYAWLHDEIKDLETTARYIELQLNEIDIYIEKLFEQVFKDTKQRFSEYFELLFGGGEGKLLRQDNPLLGTREIIIKARPPGKKEHDLNLLSGGERSLGAVALLFAILESCGTPFCVLDEVDAALDEANVGRFTQALQRLNQSSQVIMVTHNRKTMEEANCLYGTTMQEDGTTQIVSLKLQDYAGVS